jgi:protein-disulfide isomerase-like protein with CxxC motif
MKFAVTSDYLCPFARNAAEAVLAGLDRGRDWDVTFHAFSLSQVHVEEGEPPVWESPEAASGLLALQWGVAVRDSFPERFPAVHRALFSARHDQGLDIKSEEVVRGAVAATGIDVDAVAEVVASGKPLGVVAGEHTEAVERWGVFGVPTFIHDDTATFIRFMRRGDVDGLDRALDMLAWSNLNEFKRTRIPR